MRRPFHKRPWTPAEEDRLRELRGRGLELRDIAAALGRSRASVQARVVKLGLPLARWTGIAVANGEPAMTFRERHSAEAVLARQAKEAAP